MVCTWALVGLKLKSAVSRATDNVVHALTMPGSVFFADSILLPLLYSTMTKFVRVQSSHGSSKLHQYSGGQCHMIQ